MQESYERDLRAATDRTLRRLREETGDDDSAPPLCYRCNKARAWRGECVDCYMAQHSQPLFVRGAWQLPDTHNIRQGYYMQEEYYAQAHRAGRERREEFS